MPVCASCGTDNPEIAKFCLACGTPIAAEAPAPAAPAEERKLVTVVFTDLVGSTARSEQLDPEDVKAMLAPYHSRLRTELENHGGTVEKFIGDAAVALFGAPVAHEDDAERAVRAALAIRDSIAKLNEQDSWLDLHIRVGINTGEALVTLEADPSKGEWMAAGDVMNTAARLQSAAPVDGILVGEQTYRATRNVVDYRDAEPVEAKGKAEPVPVWEVVGVEDGAGRRRVDTPLVGRDAELERLLKLWEDVRGQQARVQATVVGPPGIGKSRLVTEFCDRAAASGGAVHWGRCLSYGEGITYWPVEEILKDAAGILHDDDVDAGSAKLGALVGGLDTDDRDELRTIASALANLLGVPTTPQGTYSATEISQSELHWGIRRLLELKARERPLVLVFEDLHWAEPTLLELLRSITEGAEAVPIFLLASARPELGETRRTLLQDEANRRVIELEALTEAASEALVQELTAELPAETVDTLLRTAGGNPLFLEETVRMLAEAGPAAEEGGEAVPIPTNLQALIASRLDRLPGEEKLLAQNASVIGTIFWSGALEALDGFRDSLDAALAGLERRDVVRTQDTSSVAGEREYAFKHVLMRDVAYGQLPKGRRALLHVKFADWVEALPGGTDEFAEFVAYHLEQSCLLMRAVAHPPVPPPTERAVEALVAAANKSERREGLREAERFYARALELVEDASSPVGVEVRLRRCRALTALGELRQAADGLEAVAEEARPLDRRDLRCAALVALANIDYKQGRASEARRRLTEAQATALEIGDDRLEVVSLYEFANLRAWFEGTPDAAVEDLQRGISLAQELDDRGLRIEGHMRLGTLLFNMGKLPEAEVEFSNVAGLAGEMGSYRDEARATCFLAAVAYYRSGIDEAERLALQALEWLERTGDSFFRLQAIRGLAKCALLRGAPELAEWRLREGLELALEGGGWLVIELYRYLTEALVAEGRTDDAADLVAFAARNVPEEDAYARAALAFATATVATARGEQAAAAAAFTEALRLLEELQLLVDLGEARLSWARALASFGDTAGARAELERARAMLARMGARTLLADADRELATLAAA